MNWRTKDRHLWCARAVAVARVEFGVCALLYFWCLHGILGGIFLDIFCICENPVLHDVWFKKIQKQLVSVALLEHVQGSCHLCKFGSFSSMPWDRGRYLWILAVPWGSCGACRFEEAQRTTRIRKEASSDLSENHQSFWMPPKLMWNCTSISYQSYHHYKPLYYILYINKQTRSNLVGIFLQIFEDPFRWWLCRWSWCYGLSRWSFPRISAVARPGFLGFSVLPGRGQFQLQVWWLSAAAPECVEEFQCDLRGVWQMWSKVRGYQTCPVKQWCDVNLDRVSPIPGSTKNLWDLSPIRCEVMICTGFLTSSGSASLVNIGCPSWGQLGSDRRGIRS